jgi:hypothetical protein
MALVESPSPTWLQRRIEGTRNESRGVGAILGGSRTETTRTEILDAFLKTAERRQGRRLFADGFDSQLIELWIFFYLRERFHGGQKGLNCPLLAPFRSGNLIHNRGHIQAGPFRQLA